ncbi:MAG: methionine synthase [Planctomycetota bacterium]|nr:MAG: methionine synthase [Planctomycetota bacterium]
MSDPLIPASGIPAAFQPRERVARFPILEAMSQRVLVWDGAMGTMLQEAELSDADFDGKEGCNEILVRTRPDLIAQVHRAYFESGADVVETDSFGSTSIVLAEYDLEGESLMLNRAAATIAREVADELSTPERPRFVAGSMGPTTRLVTLGHVDYSDLYSGYLEQARGLIEGGVDVLQIETCQDLLQIKCATAACKEAMRITSREVPIAVTITVETTGTMLVGSDVQAAMAMIESLPIDIIGLNCATGPDLMQEHVRFLGENSTRFVLVQPNAGLPRNVKGQTVYDLTPAELGRYQAKFVDEYGVTAIGGCCGTTPKHIAELERIAKERQPRERPRYTPPQLASIYHAVPLDQDTGPLIVGERTNANGSKKFRELLLEENWDGLVEIAKGQQREGAHVLDVCTAYVGRDETRDMRELLSRLATAVQMPIMVDSTQLDVLEASLELLGGRSVINSINLEDGEGKADAICRLARKHGAAMVALTIDEEGMAKTAEHKLEVARRIHDIVVHRHGLPSNCLLFDPLTFTIASGDEDSRDAGIQTLAGLEAIKRELPGVRTLLGLSNISFGLRPYPRRILNSVFLSEAMAKGLDAAIMNSAKIIPVHQLTDEERQVTLDLIYDRRREGYDPLFRFIEIFGDRKVTDAPAEDEMDLPVERRLEKRIIDGNKTGIEVHLDQALEKYEPLEIINRVLLEGMKVVGDLFGRGEMQLPFVLQSAETMKAAVAYLEPMMEKVDGQQKGTLVLATVRGDVHDIGKNLVDILVSNNGYKVVNLGIKQPLESILTAAQEHDASAIGMSGLLVKSTVIMKENLELMREKGWAKPVICGGAALTRGYVESDLRQAFGRREVYYGKDAFTGLHLMDEICDISAVKTLTKETPHKVVRHMTRAEKEAKLAHTVQEYVEPSVARLDELPKPPFWGARCAVGEELELRTILHYVNRRALFKFQWQYRQGKMKAAEYQELLQREVEPKYHAWVQRVLDEDMLAPSVVYGYWPCNADKNDIVIFDPEDQDRELGRFSLPRQPKGKRLCVADFFLPLSEKRRDVIAFSLVTMGQKATDNCQKLFEADNYDDYLHFYGLSIEATEALAEYWHKRIRQQLHIAEEDALEVEGLFKQKYRGSRYSFGYPACPNLQNQVQLCSMLGAERIGVSLTEDWQLVPEQATSALICHHPEAKYFNVSVR